MPDRDPHTEDEARDAGYRNLAPDERGVDGDGVPGNGVDESPEQARRSIRVRVLRILGYVFAVLCILLGALIIFLQTEPGRNLAQHLLLQRLNTLFDGAELTADDLKGGLLGDFELTDVTLVTTEGDTLAHVDTVQASYNLLYLLCDQLVLHDIRLVRPFVWMRQQPDGTWDLFNVIARDDSAAVDTAETFWTRLVIKLDGLDIIDGRLIAEYYRPGEEYVLRVRNLNLDVGEAELGDGLRLDVNLLTAEFSPPGQDYWVTTTARGRIEGNLLELSTFVLRSPRSTVSGRGTLRIPGRGQEFVEGVDFYLEASPLAFEEIRPFIPGLQAQGTADVELRLRGSGRRLTVEAMAAFPDGGEFGIEGVITPGRGGPVEYELEVTARQFDLQALLGERAQNVVLNGDIDIRLQGTDLQHLTGSLNAVLVNSSFGPYTIPRAVLESQWEDGRADFTLATTLRGASLNVSGTARPFDDVPVYDVAGRVDNLNLGNFIESTSLTTDLAGRFRVQGEGVSAEAVDLTARIDLSPSRINGYPIESAQVTVDWKGDLLDFASRVDVPEGNLVAEGLLDVGGDVLRYQIRRGRFENFDFAALFGQEGISSSLTGTFALEGQGTTPEDLDVEFAVDLMQGFYGTIPIADVTARGTLDDGLLVSSVVADLEQSGYIDVTLSTRPFQEQLAITFRDGNFHNVNLALLTGTPSLRTDLNGTVAGTLSMTERGVVVFDGRVDLTPSRINDQTITDATLLATLSGENLDFDLAINLPEGIAHLIGTAQPFESVPSYIISAARFEHIDLGALLDNPSLRSDLTGMGSLRGRGFSLGELTLSGRFNLAPSRINEQSITGADLALDINDGQLNFNTRLSLPEGRAQLVGTADLLATVTTYQVQEGSFQNINIGDFLGDPNLQTNLTGTLALQGRGLDLQTATITGHINLQESRINQQEINSATLVGQLAGGDLDYDLRLDLPEGAARLAGDAQLYARPFTYTVEEGTFTGLNLGALTNTPDLDTYLTGRIVRLEGRGLDFSQADLSARVELDESRINEQAINTAYADLELSRGILTYSIALGTPEGESNLAGTADLRTEPLRYEVSEGNFRNFNLGALLGRADLQTDLTGTLTLSGLGFDPRTMSLQAEVVVQPSIINDAEVTGGDVSLLLQSGLLDISADLILPGGRAQLDGMIRPFLEDPEYNVVGTFINVDLADFLGTDTLQAYINADFELRGIGLDPETASMQGSVQATSSRFEGIDIDSLDAVFRLNEGLLDVSQLILRSNAADVTAFGELALFGTAGAAASDFTFEADIKRAQAINSYLAPFGLAVGNGTLDGRAYTENGNLRFDADVDLGRFAYQDYRLIGLEGRVVGELGPDRRLRLGEARVTFDFASVSGFNIQAGEADFTIEGDELVFNAAFRIDEQRDVVASGQADLQQQQVLLNNLQLRFEGQTWQLLQPATITYGEQYRISNFLLYTDGQQIAVDGVIDLNGYQNLVITVENFEIATVADLLGYEGLAGTLNGSLVMTGPASDPVAEGTIFIDVIAKAEEIGDGRIDLHYEDRQVTIGAFLTNTMGGTLTVEGYIPINLALAPSDSAITTNGSVIGQGLDLQAEMAPPTSGVNLTVIANAFSIAWVEPFLPPEDYQDLDGILNADLLITGTLDEPVLEGQWTLAEGNLYLPQIGISLRNMNGTGTMTGNQIIVNRANIRSGSGSLVAEGVINLQRLTLGEFDITTSLDQFTAMDTEDFQHVVVSGQLDLQGTTDLPYVTGNARVIGADIYLDNLLGADTLGQVSLTQQDLDELEAVFGYRATPADTSTFVLFDALATDVNLEFERDTWFRQRANPEMALQLVGELEVQKEAYEDPQVFGTLEVVEGRSFVEQLGRRFDIQSGQLVFQGDPTTFYVDVTAEYRVRAPQNTGEIIITLNLEGEVGQLEPELSSDAGLDQTDILSYIATGRPASAALDLAGIGSDIAVAQLANLIEGAAAEELGLDVVSVRIDPLRGPQLVAGEYVTQDLFVGVSQSFGRSDPTLVGGAEQAATEVTLEYEIFDWLLLQLTGGQVGNRQTLRIDFRWDQAY